MTFFVDYWKSNEVTVVDYWILEDFELVELMSKDDEQAFSMLYVRYGTLLMRHALHILKDEEEAKDTIQNIFTDFWDRRKLLDIKTSVSGYLYVSTRHSILRQLQKGRKEDAFLEHLITIVQQEVPGSDVYIREEELKILIESEVSKLPPKMREVFLLSRRDHLSHKEIAQKLGLSEFTVKRQTSNALSILRKRLGHLYGVAIIFL